MYAHYLVMLQKIKLRQK